MVLIIFKMIATSGFLADLECSKFVFCPGTHWGNLKRSPKPLIVAVLRGTTSKERGGKRGERERPYTLRLYP